MVKSYHEARTGSASRSLMQYQRSMRSLSKSLESLWRRDLLIFKYRKSKGRALRVPKALKTQKNLIKVQKQLETETR